MKVILLKDVNKLGKKDDIIEVNQGYANNCLLKQNLAIVADNANLNKLRARQRMEDAQKQEELEKAKECANEMKTKEYNLEVKVGANGKIFGSVTSAEIADVIAKVSNIKIDKRKIVLKETIKNLGMYNVTLKLHPEVSVDIKVMVNGKK